MRRLLLLAGLLSLNACATIIDGSRQTIAVTTDPPAATCTLTRQDQTIGTIPATPGSVSVTKNRYDINVACSKAGYGPASETARSQLSGATFLNILAGGVVGVVVDMSSGANRFYPAEIQMTLPLAPSPGVMPTS